MRWPTGIQLIRVLAAVTLLAWVGLLVRNRFLLPKDQTATLDQILAVVDKELLEEEPIDGPDTRHLADLIGLIAAYDDPSPHPHGTSTSLTMGARVSPWFCPQTLPSNGKTTADFPVWSGHQVHGFKDYLDQIRPKDCRYNVDVQAMIIAKSGIRSLEETARSRMKSNDPKGACLCLILALRFADLMLNSGGEMLHYLTAQTAESIAVEAIEDFARDPGFSAVQCKEILAELSPAPDSDAYLASALKLEFQHFDLSSLSQKPIESPQNDNSMNIGAELRFKSSTFDPIKTAKQLTQLTLTEIDNSKRTWSQFDDAGDRIAQRAREIVGDDGTIQWESEVERQSGNVENKTDNDVGLRLIALAGDSRFDIKISLRWRTMRNAVRALLASRIYRATHGGNLPSFASELTPQLGAWPTDLYDGQPMRYNPIQQVVYSIGPNLRDDGGDITGKWKGQRDIGVSLALARN